MSRLYRRLLFLTSLCALAGISTVAPAEIKLRVLALFENKAILEVDGKRRVLSKGDTSPEGVQLLEANTAQAIVMANGRRETLLLETVSGSFAGSQRASVTLYATGNVFVADGMINNVPVRFLVDTGATTVALNSATARKVGIDYLKGQPGIATTASGVVKVYSVKLEKVKVGDIVLSNVQAGVIDGPQPQTALLGMSFLNSVEMRRDGNRMDLIKR